MTHAADDMKQLEGAPASEARSRAAAFEHARRNSRRVSWLKAAIVIGSAGATCVLAYVSFFNPFGNIPKNLSVSGAAVNGSEITIEHPKLVGFKKDGRPYQLLAASGVQDIRKPSIVRLTEIDATMTMPDKSVLRLRAPRGVYDSTNDDMRLKQDILVTNSTGYKARLRSADLNFKAGTISTREPVVVTTSTTTINANSMLITDGGETVTFSGDVESVMGGLSQPARSDGSAAPVADAGTP